MQYLAKTIEMMNDFCHVLVEMERKGICIDLKELNKLKEYYTTRRDELKIELQLLAEETLGDTPINLDSPEQLSNLVFSRKVVDKTKWKNAFNLKPGASNMQRIGLMKRYSDAQFVRNVKAYTEVLMKTTAEKCGMCYGTGKVQKYKKDGSKFAKANLCKSCVGGVVYTKTEEIAGFKLRPDKIDVTASGFSTSSDVLTRLIEKAKTQKAKDFLMKMSEYNAIDTYVNSFIGGIERGVRGNILYPQFMQCVTATGRLSSRNPNFQNQPRGDTFPIRRVVTSRFEGGKIMEIDFAQLEFRVAAELAGDEQALSDILNKVDIHSYTASIIGCTRQEAKVHTFKPLYGGTYGNENEMRYYKAFKEKYYKVAEWQEANKKIALNTKEIRLPTGRAYHFPNCKRTQWGGVTNSTNICNYPVQGYATADIVPVCCVEVYNKLKDFNSLLINTVHDSIVVDVHPDDIEMMPGLLNNILTNAHLLLKDRYGINFNTPLDAELKAGVNWLDTEVVTLAKEKENEYRTNYNRCQSTEEIASYIR